jgi:S1-C subfamily serine protease
MASWWCAAAAGIQHGDRLVAIDGSEVRDLADLYRALWGRGEAGIMVDVTVIRQGKRHEIGVKTIDGYRYLKLGTTY